MKRLLITALTISLLGFSTLSIATKSDNKDNKNKKILTKADIKNTSYAVGYSLGHKMKQDTYEFSLKDTFQGITDAYNQVKKPRLSKQEVKEFLILFQYQQAKHRRLVWEKASNENLAEGKKFQAEFKKKKGVKNLANGIDYRVLKEGKGKSPTLNDEITVEYTGRTIHGRIFATTENAMKPFSALLRLTIPGWTQTVQKMHKGDKWEVVIPPELAYGKQGIKNRIGPNETLIFVIHLVDFKKVKQGDS